MKVAERDELFGRLDERTESIIRELQTQNKHLAEINGSIQKHQDNLVGVNTTVYGKGNDKGLCGEIANTKKIVYVILVLLTGGSALGGLELADVIHLFGG